MRKGTDRKAMRRSLRAEAPSVQVGSKGGRRGLEHPSAEVLSTVDLRRALRLGHRIDAGHLCPKAGPAALVQRVGNKKVKAVNQKRIQDYIAAGRMALRRTEGLIEFRDYLTKEQVDDAAFILGAVSGRFSLKTVVSPLQRLNHPSSDTADNKRLQKGIKEMMKKTLEIKNPYTKLLAEDFAQFQEGRISELEGMAGELRVAAQFAGQGSKVRGLGEIYRMEQGTQEVDLTIEHGGVTYYVEVAATASKLRDKIKKGLKGHYPQLDRYRQLMAENSKTRVAYASPDLTPNQLSSEFVSKLEEAKVDIVLGGKIYTPSEAGQLTLEEERLKGPDLQGAKREMSGLSPSKAKSRRREQKKRSRRGYRRQRLQDRGTPAGKGWATREIEDYLRDPYDIPEPEPMDEWDALENEIWDALSYWNGFSGDSEIQELFEDGQIPLRKFLATWMSEYPHDYPEETVEQVKDHEESYQETIWVTMKDGRALALS